MGCLSWLVASGRHAGLSLAVVYCRFLCWYVLSAALELVNGLRMRLRGGYVRWVSYWARLRGPMAGRVSCSLFVGMARVSVLVLSRYVGHVLVLDLSFRCV